jgi:hypothetical protein
LIPHLDVRTKGVHLILDLWRRRDLESYLLLVGALQALLLHLLYDYFLMLQFLLGGKSIVDDAVFLRVFAPLLLHSSINLL